MRPIKKVISGGQTGVDRAGLVAARQRSIEIGGWCPRGRRAEDGKVPDEFPLIEMDTDAYIPRTYKNVDSSHATMIVTRSRETDNSDTGTLRTEQYVRRVHKPFNVIYLPKREEWDGQLVLMQDVARAWIKTTCDALNKRWEARDGLILNVSGPRESGDPGIYAATLAFLLEVFA